MKQKWLCRGEIKDGEGEKKLKEKSAVHVVRSCSSPQGTAGSQYLEEMRTASGSSCPSVVCSFPSEHQRITLMMF